MGSGEEEGTRDVEQRFYSILSGDQWPLSFRQGEAFILVAELQTPIIDTGNRAFAPPSELLATPLPQSGGDPPARQGSRSWHDPAATGPKTGAPSRPAPRLAVFVWLLPGPIQIGTPPPRARQPSILNAQRRRVRDAEVLINLPRRL